MGKAVLVVQRRALPPANFSENIASLNRMLMPAHIDWPEPQIGQRSGLIVAVFNPNEAAHVRDTSAWLGVATEKDAQWSVVGSRPPSGSFAVFRANENHAELVADSAASRTIWYALTDELFIASTSQRAVVALLGDFLPNPDVVPWMLSSGTLGPSGGWDSRLKQVLPAQTVRLDRSRWRLKVETDRLPRFEPQERSMAENLEQLEQLSSQVCRGMNLDPGRWMLPLSGGVDSRGLLYALSSADGAKSKWRTVTWGAHASSADVRYEVDIARQVAAKQNVEHRFFSLAMSDETRETFMQRFLIAGEGRVATMTGYTDAFATWKTLYEEGHAGIVRGDEAFGSHFVSREYDVRKLNQLLLMSDFFQAEELDSFELQEQHIPDKFKQGDGESLETWRDRLYQDYRLQSFCAPLTDMKCSYVEVANPLLARPLLEFSRQLPDSLRTDKLLWRKLVTSQSGGIPFAVHPAVMPVQNILNDTSILEVLHAELSSIGARRLLNDVLCRKICRNIESVLRTDPERRQSLNTQRPLAFLPRKMRAFAARMKSERRELNPLVFAFRAYIVSRMARMLEADVTVQKNARLEYIEAI